MWTIYRWVRSFGLFSLRLSLSITSKAEHRVSRLELCRKQPSCFQEWDSVFLKSQFCTTVFWFKGIIIAIGVMMKNVDDEEVSWPYFVLSKILKYCKTMQYPLSYNTPQSNFPARWWLTTCSQLPDLSVIEHKLHFDMRFRWSGHRVVNTLLKKKIN